MNAPFNKEQIAAALEGMKKELAAHEGQVQRMTVDAALETMGQMAAVCDTFGVKFVQEFFNEVQMTFIVGQMRTHNHVTFDMHFPCGAKYRVVVHHNAEANAVFSFAYKL